MSQESRQGGPQEPPTAKWPWWFVCLWIAVTLWGAALLVAMVLVAVDQRTEAVIEVAPKLACWARTLVMPWVFSITACVVLTFIVARRAVVPRGGEIVEASMNFDLENVRPFLQRIMPLVDSGFGEVEIERIVSIARSMNIDDERELTFEILHQGRKSPFRVMIFMDDIDAPDLYFFGPPALAAQIDAEMASFCDELGI